MVAACLALFIIQPLLKPGLPTAADLVIHMYRTLEYQQAWAPGVIAPRWAPNLAYGYGYPLFVFAPPLPYLLGALFQLPGLTIETAFKLLIILTIQLYAIGMYLFARDLFRSVEAGLVAAVAYAFAPFALREALLYGGNVPQFLAIALFPWALWAALLAVETGGRAAWRWAVRAGLFYAAIMLSHLFQVLIFSPVFGLYILLLILVRRAGALRQISGRAGRLRSFALPLFAIPIGLLLSAFFWLPVLLERSFTRAQAGIYLEKSPFFVRYPHWTELLAWIRPLDFRAANPYVPLTLGLVTLILAGLGLLLAVGQPLFRRRTPNAAAPASLAVIMIFFGLVAAGAALMSLLPSQPVWETVDILQVAEFPWRMLGLANLGLAVLAGAAVAAIPRRFRRPAAALCVALQLLAVAPYLYPVTAFTQHGSLTIADQIAYERSSQSIGTTTLGEYLPRTVTRPPKTSPLVSAFEANQYPERLDRTTLPAGAAAELLAQTAITHRYSLDSPAPFTLRFFQFYYPGWRAELNDRPVNISIEAETGLMLVDIPPGQHTLTFHFGETTGRLIAIGLTAVALAGLILIALAGYRQPAPPPVGPPPARLPLNGTATLAALAALLIAALWLKPLLQPLFTLASPPGRVLPARHQADLHFANGIRLAGYDLSSRVVEPGDYLQIVLYWETDSAPHRVNLQPFVHLDRLDDFTTLAGSTNYTPGDVTTETNMPTFHWDNSRYVRDEHDLTIPPGAPPLAYAVRVGLIDPDRNDALVELAGGGDTARLDTINVKPSQQDRQAPPQLARPLDLLFSNQQDAIHLTGFETTGLTPERLRFTLAWKSDRNLQADYTVFAQLLDSQRRLAAGFDRPPLDGAYPTGTWLPGQTILDPRHIPLAGLPPGEYTLIVGLYDSATGQRLTTPAGADFAELTTINIE